MCRHGGTAPTDFREVLFAIGQRLCCMDRGKRRIFASLLHSMQVMKYILRFIFQSRLEKELYQIITFLVHERQRRRLICKSLNDVRGRFWMNGCVENVQRHFGCE
jgi:hypothetical protein